MFDFVPLLTDGTLTLSAIEGSDFEALYACASDKLIWAQHPSKDRYKRKVFEQWFAAVRSSDGALKIIDNESQVVIGSSRYYDFDANKKEVSVGYTFISRQYWGGETNKRLKTLMFNHAFKVVEKIWLDIDPHNIRSQKAAEKIGAVFSHQQIKQMAGVNQDYVVYRVDRAAWQA